MQSRARGTHEGATAPAPRKPGTGRARSAALVALLLIGMITAAAGELLATPDDVDLWIASVHYEPLVPDFQGYLPGIPIPTHVTVELRKQGSASAAGAMLAFNLNGTIHNLFTVSDLPSQQFDATLDIDGDDTFVAEVDPSSIIPELDELNNRLGRRFGDGAGNGCGICPASLEIQDPDGGQGDTMTLTCQSNDGDVRSGKFPFALLILPPYEIDEASPAGTMRTELDVEASSGEESEESAGVTAGLAIEAEIGLDEDAQVTIGVGIEAGIEAAKGTNYRITSGETFSAQATAAQGETADHTVVLSQTRYRASCKYRVSGSATMNGKHIWVGIPDDDQDSQGLDWANPELTGYSLSSYDEMADPTAVRLKASHRIGDADGYPSGIHSGSYHHDEADADVVATSATTLCGQVQSVATGGAASWHSSIEEGSYASTKQTLKVNMYAKAEIGAVNVQASFGVMSGRSHRIYEGKKATFRWTVGQVRDEEYEYTVGGYALNYGITHTVHADDGDYDRPDGYLLMCYYVSRPSSGGPFGDWDFYGWHRGAWRATLAYNPQASGGQIIARYEGLLANPRHADPLGYYQQLSAITDEEIAWGLQFDPQQYPRVPDFLDKTDRLRADLDWILANDPDNPGHRDHVQHLLANANVEARTAFDPRPGTIEPAAPRAGGVARIRYNPARGALPPGPPVLLRIGYDGGQGMHDEPMIFDPEAGMWAVETAVPPGVETLDYVFTNGYDLDDRAGLGWHAETAADLRTHANGNVAVSFTAHGTLGFTDGAQTEGEGFRYPASGPNSLYLGGLWVGNADFVANRDYDAEPDREWVVDPNDPGGIHLWSAGPAALSHAAYTDSGAAAPRGLVVYQGAVTRAGAPDDDFVIVSYLVRNRGSVTLADLYVGQFADLDLGASFLENRGGTDPDLQLVYMYEDAATPHVGVVLLDPGMTANLTLIDNPTHVYPNQYIPDAEKALFLSAADPAHSVAAATEDSDWSLLASAGPYTLDAGEAITVSFALVAGDDLADLLANAEQARLSSPPATTAVAPLGGSPRAVAAVLFQNAPNPFNPSTRIAFELPARGAAVLRIFDATGRTVRTLLDGEQGPGLHTVTWDGRSDAGRRVGSGIYFYRLETAGGVRSRKMVMVR